MNDTTASPKPASCSALTLGFRKGLFTNDVMVKTLSYILRRAAMRSSDVCRCSWPIPEIFVFFRFFFSRGNTCNVRVEYSVSISGYCGQVTSRPQGQSVTLTSLKGFWRQRELTVALVKTLE